MTVLTDKEFIRRRFSNAAPYYGERADLQSGIARDLALRADVVLDERVLDVGAGDGVLTQTLAASGAGVVALDGAWGMVCQGRRRSPDAAWVQADATALPFAAGQFDLVTSSSAYQWVDDLPGAFREARRVLKPGGRFMVAMFGYGTLDELFVSIERASQVNGRTLPVLKRLPTVEEVHLALDKAEFKHSAITVEKRMADFKDVKAILLWLKGIGANVSARNFFWGKSFLAATEMEYRANFADRDHVRATFEVIWIDVRL